MRILVVTQYFWPEDFRINDLTVSLARKGHDVVVLTGIPNYPGGRFFPGYGVLRNLRQEHGGVKILRVPIIPRGQGGRIRLILNYFSFMVSALIFFPFMSQGKFDVILFSLSPVAEGIPAVLLKWLKKASLVFWVQDLWPESLSASKMITNTFLHAMTRKVVAGIYRACDKVLVQSRAFAPFVSRMGVSESRISYFPNFAEDFYKPVDPDSVIEERAALPAGFIVMFAGNIGASQDFPAIISAAEKLKDRQDIYWVIIGDGRMRQWAEEEITRRHLTGRFIFLGRRPAESMPRYFALADVLLVTLRDEEIFERTIPSKVQSYLACGKPIIASLAGEGARVIEESGAGFSCSPKEPSGLAELVLKMYDMKENERHAMGLNGRRYFENNFSREKLVDELEGMLEGMKGTRI